MTRANRARGFKRQRGASYRQQDRDRSHRHTHRYAVKNGEGRLDTSSSVWTRHKSTARREPQHSPRDHPSKANMAPTTEEK